jgi:hypothetical protein
MKWVQDIIAPQYDWFYTEVVPPVVELVQRLDIPEWSLYRAAVQECAADFLQSSQSTGKVWYLTMKPIAILVWVFLQFLLEIGQILFQLFLEQGWISFKKGLRQAKAASVWFYGFQRSLSRTEVLGELGIVVLCVVLYYLRRWLKRQTYWARATKYYREKKRKAVQVRRKTRKRAMMKRLTTIVSHRTRCPTYLCCIVTLEREGCAMVRLGHLVSERRDCREYRPLSCYSVVTI